MMNPTLELIIVGFVLLTAVLYVGRQLWARGEPACTASDSCAKCAARAAKPKPGAYRTTPLVRLHPKKEGSRGVRISS